MELLVFSIAAIVALASAVMVITIKNPVGSILYLILSIMAQSVLYIMLSGLFVAAFLVLIYGGAILVLFLFVVMMLNVRHADLGQDTLGNLKPLAWIFGTVLLVEFVWVAVSMHTRFSMVGNRFGSVEAAADLLYGRFVYPFELTSILLLTAIVGAVVIIRKGPQA